MNGSVKSHPSQRRYSPELKERAVRMVLALRAEMGEKQGSVKRVADQLDIAVESLRSWVKQHEIDGGVRPGVTSSEAARPGVRGSGGRAYPGVQGAESAST